jgi:hypothetical protein
MMRGSTQITFRNREDVTLTWRADVFGPGRGYSVEDWQIECADCNKSMRLMPLTESEETEVYDAIEKSLHRHLEDAMFEYDETDH